MDNLFKGLGYLFIALGVAVFVCGLASFVLPETSAPSIIFEKAKFLAMYMFAQGWVLVLLVDNKRLRQGVRK